MSTDPTDFRDLLAAYREAEQRLDEYEGPGPAAEVIAAEYALTSSALALASEVPLYVDAVREVRSTLARAYLVTGPAARRRLIEDALKALDELI